MAVETRVLVNGAWVTRTVDLSTVLRHQEQRDMEESHNPMDVEQTPVFGMLTQTVIQSPLVHHILPIKLRGLEFNDVAFIGEEFVQIKELRADGFLWDLARKENFGARIRNARVVGSIEDFQKDFKGHVEGQVKDEESGIDMLFNRPIQNPQSQHPKLSPQYLLLQLDTGDSVFLMLRQTTSGIFEFIVTGQHRVPRKMLNYQPGMYLTVDPSSRFAAVACSEEHFAVYALKSRNELESQHAKGLDLQHITADAYLPFQGTLQKMEFLYPPTGGQGLVVLLLLVTFKARTRMLLYEWKLGDDIRKIRSQNQKGHMLGEAHQMPLLLIPLKFKSTFILVSENIMGHFQNILEGDPQCTEFHHQVDDRTEHHHGVSPPLWVGWARPTNRHRAHFDHRDDIYIAREDGLLKFLEIDCNEFVESEMDVGKFEGRCGTALAYIDYRDGDNRTGDLLITGGDACQGGAYLIRARATPELIQPIANWTPTQDFITVPGELLLLGNKAKSKKKEIVPRPDRIFACVGKGNEGLIAEFRYGVEARIGLHFEYDFPIMHAWALPFDLVAYGHTDGTLFVLSVGNSSVGLRLLGDESSVEVISNDMTKLDLTHQTIAIKIQNDCIIQVTEKSLVLIEHSGSKVFEADQLLHIQERGQTVGLGVTLFDAIIDGRYILYTTILGNMTYLLMVDLTTSDKEGINKLDQDGKMICSFSDRVTCLTTVRMENNLLAIVAEWSQETTTNRLTFQPVSIDTEPIVLDISLGENFKVEAVESMVVLPNSTTLSLVCGTRDGVLLILELDVKNSQILKSEQHRMGTSSVSVKLDELVGTHQLFLVGCDAKAFALTFNSHQHGLVGHAQIRQMWFSDALNPEISQPMVNSLTRHVPSSGNTVHDRLLVIAGSQLLLTSLDITPKAVPRYFKIKGTPECMVYSRQLRVFIVAVFSEMRATLLFIDPDTGEDISNPVATKGGPTIQYAQGLGQLYERVTGLFEWSYAKGSNVWNFIIASTNLGKFLIISTDNQESENAVSRHGSSSTSRPKISYWTKNKIKSNDPFHSITGFPEGLIWSAGEILYCHTLDNAEKKLKQVASYELPSFARTLHYSNGLIYALTQLHSLEVLALERHDDGAYTITRKYGDQLSRSASNHIAIEQPGREGRSLHIVSDKFRSFVGLWPTNDAIADTLETVIEGQVASTIVKFQNTRCRPLWDPAWDIKNTAFHPLVPMSAVVDQDTLGLTIDGALCRFTLLEQSAWKFLRFLINLCMLSKTICEFSYFSGPVVVEVVTTPKTMMHIDGDILYRCLRDRRLEELLQIGSEGEKVKDLFAMFVELLQAAHRGLLEIDAAAEVYIAQAYADLELYLRPMM